MKLKYAVISPQTGTEYGFILSLHRTLFNALRGKTKSKVAAAQVRELVAPAHRWGYIVYDHLRRWDP